MRCLSAHSPFASCMLKVYERIDTGFERERVTFKLSELHGSRWQWLKRTSKEQLEAKKGSVDWKVFEGGLERLSARLHKSESLFVE